MKTQSKELAFLILAAGKGTRMKNDLPKVLHEVAGKKLVGHVIDLAKEFQPKILLPIISPVMDDVENFIRKKAPEGKIIYQKEQLGTGHAVKICLGELKGFSGTVVALYGDTPLIESGTIEKMIHEINSGAAVCVLGFEVDRENAYGRLVLDKNGLLKEIVEFKEADEKQKKIKLCNSGVMAFNGEYIEKIINSVKDNNSKKEFYLTDAVGIANEMGLKATVVITDENEVIGINSQQEPAEAEKVMQDNLRKKHMENGVIIIDPGSVFFTAETEVEAGTVIEPFVIFKGSVKIGKNCKILAHSYLEDCVIEAKCSIGPYARIRPGTEMAEGSKLGNFVEVKKSKIGKGSKINHLSYIGDTNMGENVNIGAGVITCNYDGKNKFVTEIGDGAFIGSNSELIAPVKIGDNAVIGAGTTLLKDAESGKVTVNNKELKSFSKKKV